MFGLTSKQRNATKMVCYSELTSSPMSAEIKPILILEKNGIGWYHFKGISVWNLSESSLNLIV